MRRSELADIDKLIQAGQIEESKALLSAINSKKVGREDLNYLANLLRRTGQADESLKILRPFVRPKSKTPQKATISEIFEYAISLISLGAINEGTKLLEPISEKEHPEKLLHLAFARIFLWDYSGAANLLENYTSLSKDNNYSLLVAKVNLLSCYVYLLEYEKSEKLLNFLLEKTHDIHHKRLKCSIYRFKTQLHLSKNEIDLAKEALEKSQTYTESKDSLDNLLYEKWTAIIQLQAFGPTQQAHANLLTVRAKAHTLQSIETIRDIDFYEALYFNDKEKLLFVYFGTPYESYRNKIIKSYKRLHKTDFLIPPTYSRLINPEKGNNKNETKAAGSLKIHNGVNSFSKETLRSGQLIQSLLALLSSDFYKPVELYKIHNDLFANDYFNALSTVTKIRQLVHRLNSWFKESHIPLEVHSKKGFYNLAALKPIEIHFSLEKAPDIKIEELFSKLKNKISDKTFSSKEASKILQIPYRSFMEYLREAHTSNIIEKIGSGPKSKYQFKNED